MIQCKDSIVILRRSEDRRRICNLSPNRFLTALRLSFSSLLGIVRKRSLRSLRSSIRSAQDDKVSLSGIRSQPAGPARLGEPNDTPAIVTKTIVPHPPPHSFERLLISACCGLPPRVFGRLGARRHVGRLLCGGVLRCRQSRFGFLSPGHGLHGPIERCDPRFGSFRALRPASAEVAFYAGFVCGMLLCVDC